MTRTAVARAIRRGVGLALLLATPMGVGCGGSTSACGITSSQPTTISCGYVQSFAFHGTPATCGADSLGGFLSNQCANLCPAAGGAPATACTVDWSANPETISCTYDVPIINNSCHIPGSRPAGLCPPSGPVANSLTGQLLADLAHLEAASVHAFALLARELQEHGARSRFRAKIRRAARDEIRHAAMMNVLAEHAGAHVAPVCVRHGGRRTLEAIALENAIEGCVGETYGAAVAHIQARRATDPRVRVAMKRIAADETRHAELSFELARWFDKNMDAAGCRRVRNARSRAAQALVRSVRRANYGAAAAALGLPTVHQSLALINALRQSLWT
jgi:hypothetical protein